MTETTNKEIVIDALRAGKNVICEKPVTMSSEDLEEMIAVANESIAVTKSGDEEAFLPAELQPKSETDYDGATTESFDFILEKGAKVDILNTDFNPNVINLYADNSYDICPATEEYTTYEDWSQYCFARQEIVSDAPTTDVNYSIYIYNSESGQYVLRSDVAIGTTTQYTDASLIQYQQGLSDAEVKKRAKKAKELAEKYDLTFITLQDKLDEAAKLAPNTYWLRDGVHPTTMGHELIKNEWIKAFNTITK